MPSPKAPKTSPPTADPQWQVWAGEAGTGKPPSAYQRSAPTPITPPPELSSRFGPRLLALVADIGDLCDPQTWEVAGRLILEHFDEFGAGRGHQSALATWKMLGECAKLKMQCQLVKDRLGGEDDNSDKAHADFQQLMDELQRPESDDDILAPVTLETDEEEADE